MKKLLPIILTLLLVCIAVSYASAANVVASPQNLSVDGVDADCDKYNIDGSNYFKLRDLAQLLSKTDSRFSVSFDEQSNAVTVVSGKEYTPVGGELARGRDQSKTAVVSKQSVLIDGKAADGLPDQYHVSFSECKNYIYDVMFRRTFSGYNRENQALTILHEVISPMVQEAPEDWDTQYFIDFYVYSSRNELIGIQLKPETFYMGRYQYKVDIRGKMNAFCRDKNARAFILKYSVASDRSGIIFTNPEVINEIQTYL